MEKPNLNNELVNKKALEDTEGNVSGFRTFSDATLLQEIHNIKQRMVELSNPLDATENEKNMTEYGVSPMNADDMKKTEMLMLEDHLRNLELEIERRQSLN